MAHPADAPGPGSACASLTLAMSQAASGTSRRQPPPLGQPGLELRSEACGAVAAAWLPVPYPAAAHLETHTRSHLLHICHIPGI